MIRRAALARVLALSLVLSAAASLAAQTYLATEPGTWKPWKMTTSSDARRTSQATAAELKAFEAQLVAFREILHHAPSAAQPRGYSVEAWGFLRGATGADASAAKTRPIAGGVDFGAFPIFEYTRNGKTIREDTGETALLLFAVNDLTPGTIGLPPPEEWRELETDVVLQPRATGERAGWLVYDDLMVLTKRKAPLWTPLTLESAWQLQLQAAQQKRSVAQEAVDRFKAQLAKATDPVQRAARKAEYVKNAPQMPDPQAYLKQMEQVEQITEDTVRKELAPTSSMMKNLTELERGVKTTEDRIARLTTTEKTAPACYVDHGTAPEAQFRAAPAPGCAPIVRPNPDFFDRSLPRSAPQVVMLLQARRCYEDDTKTTLVSGCPANRALLESLDRQAVLDWLK